MSRIYPLFVIYEPYYEVANYTDPIMKRTKDFEISLSDNIRELHDLIFGKNELVDKVGWERTEQ